VKIRIHLIIFLCVSILVVISRDLEGQNIRVPVQLDPGNPLSMASDPVVQANAGRVYAAWTDLRSGGHGVYFTRSIDNGKTFAPEVRLDGDALGAVKDLPASSLLVDAHHVYVYWLDERDGADDVYFCASHDGGLTFDSEIRIDDSGVPGGSDVKDVVMAVSGSNVYLAMNVEVFSSDEDVFLSISTDGGSTFSAAIHASQGNPGDHDVDTIGLACHGSAAFVAFDEDSGGNDDLYGRSFDNLGSLGAVVRIDTDATGYGDVEDAISVLMTSADDIHVFWQEERLDPLLLAEELRYNRSSDGGKSFGTTDVLLGGYAAGLDDVDNHTAMADGGTILLAWEDNRSGSDEAYIASSTDGGATWNADIQVSAAGSTAPRLALDGDVAGIAWSGPEVVGQAWVAWSRDGGTTFGAPVNVSLSSGDVDRVVLDVDTVYRSLHAVYLDDVRQGNDWNNVFAGGFRSAGLSLVGDLVSGHPHYFEIDGAGVGESGGGNAFTVVLSANQGSTLIPGDGRDVGLNFDQLFRASLNLTQYLSGTVDAAGKGTTPVIPLKLPPGTVFYAAGVVRLAGGGYGSITDPIRTTVL
jgi:hypothetical protein